MTQPKIGRNKRQTNKQTTEARQKENKQINNARKIESN